MINHARSDSRVYVVRVWFEISSTGDQWRASVLDSNTQEKRYFSSPEALGWFLHHMREEPDKLV